MFCRIFGSAVSHELVVKIIFVIVLFVLVLNLYILSIIFKSEEVTYKRIPDKENGILIKREPLKRYDVHYDKKVSKKAIFAKTNTTNVSEAKIIQKLAVLKRQYVGNASPISAETKHSYQALLDGMKESGQTSSNILNGSFKWINSRQLFPEAILPKLGRVLYSLNTIKIERSENLPHGTQLKLVFSLERGLKAVFKPQWYKRTEVISGEVFAGKDRHNGEVAAFHLSLLLGLRRVPFTEGRRINVQTEIIPFASSDLLKTFYRKGNNTCFYGVCYYCNPKDPVCASQDILEGALILWIPQDFQLKKFRHPWQRTYKPNVPARWELDAKYCQVVQKADQYSRGPRLLDLVETSIFDFLIDNGDRHHYEVFQNMNDSAVLFIDNGKSFANPHKDHIDILAPLYQCCRLRRSTWSRLLWLHNEKASVLLYRLLEWSHIAPVLTDAHLAALDRRLLIVIAAVHVCFDENNGQQNVIVSD